MDKKQNLEVKINYDKPAFYVGELITGNLVLNSEKSSIIEKIVAEIYLIQKWKIDDNSILLKKSIGNTEFDLSASLSKVEG